MSTSNNNQTYLFKLLSLFSVVRGYNILTLVAAQYLAALFIFSPQKSVKNVLLDANLFLVVLATVCVVASGYIINNFYDKETDQINRPVKSRIDSYVSQQTKLTIYFSLNFVGVLFAFFVSWKAALFFSVYIFLIWFYSHKLKRYPMVGLFSVTTLTILPFFAVFVYFKNFSEIIFIHAFFLFALLLIRELVKNMENMQGDILVNYHTVPIKYGISLTKKFITIISIAMIVPMYILWQYPEIGWMKIYFITSLFGMPLFLFLLWKSDTKSRYRLLHNLIKLLIFAGIFSLVLIDVNLIIDKILNN
ncbi:geranylgeranylglycerol-phosphate geranylgeranyltransferase [Urechidicola vernalis]|uniref:Geranylgeranylglycerol-phosphate geranylgeranyltransferase n=1 Tax=Urechidicola vernalis TaxID=3075600 RepID=A0ABU2Y4B3_9FLAO|nr:geranylgeranylglycerol-phosphate geranylgeranyltransferase [Urechidicola sp. P050]MDT0552897.1 geranylgeranylglycerol-phosphate geranylgeranyltransferase [Urechidicola sp. P050]